MKQINLVKNEKGGEKRHRFVQALVCPYQHKALKRLALDQDITLAELLKEIIKLYLRKENVELCQKKRN